MTEQPNGAQPEADVDLDAWIDGTTGITGVARIVQRGDLLAARDRLVMELEIVQKIPADQRGLDDRTPDVVQAELEQVYDRIWSSMLYIHIQDRTEARREGIANRLKAQKVTDLDTIGLHVIADAIVKVETPDGRVLPLPVEGFPPEKLRRIRDRGGDAALLDVNRVFREVVSQAPAVRAPLSRGSSSRTGGRM